MIGFVILKIKTFSQRIETIQRMKIRWIYISVGHDYLLEQTLPKVRNLRKDLCRLVGQVANLSKG
jgi:2,4-dienoyl-CoA reductase-like NADH-dependent reductase (Old Yellow Enzyme family)